MGKYQQQPSCSQSQQEIRGKKTKPIQKQSHLPKTSMARTSQQQISLIQSENPSKPQIRQFIYMSNVEFYLNKMSSSPNGTFIDLMHKHWWGNYILLQTNHSYIQWLFPNSFQSRFNQSAKPLTKQQAKHFRQNLDIARRFVHSYEMILEFFGMKLRNKVTGQVTRTIVPRYKDRYDETLLSAYHNHLRVTRILCSLTEVGFAFYARQWCKFLKKEIYEHNGRLIRLKHMDVYKHWRPYEGDQKQRSNKIDCEDTPNIYLRELWKQQGYNPLIKQRSKWSQIYQHNKHTITLQDDSDQQKIETKKLQNQQNKKESKFQPKQPTLNSKNKLQQQKLQKQKGKQRKIELISKEQSNSQQRYVQSQLQSSDFELSQDQVQERQYGRRGSKQHQALRRQLGNSQNDIEKQKVFRQIRKQQEYEHKLQQHIKSKLLEDSDNYVKKQMKQIRQTFEQKLKDFRKKGTRLAETIEEREKRMMRKNTSPDDVLQID